MQIQILFTTLTNTYNKYNEYMTLACSGLANLDKGFGMHCHLPLQEVDYFDNKLEFSDRKIAIGQGFR